MSRFYSEGDLMGFGYGSNFDNPQFMSNLSQFRASLFTHNPCSTSAVSSDTDRRKRKVTTYLSGEYPAVENAPLTKKSKLSPTLLSDEGSSCVDEDTRSCVTTVSRVSAHPKSVEQLRLENEMQRQKEDAVRALENAKKPVVSLSLEDNARAAMLKCRFAETILRAQQKLGVNQPVDVKRYKLGAKVELRRELQKQREAARKKLQELEKSVDVQDSFKVLRDFKALIGGCSASNSSRDRVHRPIEAPRFVNCR